MQATPRARSSRPTAVSATPATQPSGNTPEDVLVNQNVAGVGTLPGVVETTVGGATNVHFASQALLGDSNLLSNAIQSVVLGTSPGVALHTSRDAGIVAARMDMDQSQFPADVSPAGGGPGHLRPADPDPAAVEAAIRFHSDRTTSTSATIQTSDRSVNHRLDEEPAVLSGRSRRWAARSARTPTPI